MSLLHRSQPGTVPDGHVFLWLHQTKAISAEVKLGNLCVLAAQLQIKMSQQQDDKSAERGGVVGCAALTVAGPGKGRLAQSSVAGSAATISMS